MADLPHRRLGDGGADSRTLYDPAKALLLAELYPKGFEVTMNLTAWPGRGLSPRCREAVATYWEKVGIKVKRRPVDRAIFAADFRARAYSGVTLAYAAPWWRSSPGKSSSGRVIPKRD